MGTQISANYDNIEPMLTSNIWTIHTGVHKVSKEVVCLWAIDVPKLKDRYRKKALRNRYLDVILASLTQMRKYRHPRILKVLEIAEKKPEVGFSSEPFTKIISTQIANIHPMDVAYISYQIAEVFNFLSNDARIVHLGLNPTAVLMDDQMSVKLTQFQWASPFDSNGTVTLSQAYNDLSKEFGDNYYKAPEMLKESSAPITNQADVFIFGLFVFEAFTGHKFYDSSNPDEILNSLSTKFSQISAESKIPADFITLLKGCLNPDPASRPTFSNIITSPAYQSMQLKSLRYIDVMLTKNPSDKFAFYKGLSKKIDEFSPSLQRIKLLPTLVNECIADVRFAPILIGAIFKISVNFTSEEFMNLVWKKLSVLATVINPPEVSIALLRNLWLLMEKVDKRIQKDYVYPIIFSALNSQEPKIHAEVLKHIDSAIEDMSPETIRTLILPRLLDLAKTASNASVVTSSLACIVKSLRKVDNEAFCEDALPKVIEVWRTLPTSEIGSCLLDMFVNLKISHELIIFRLLPIVCEITVNRALSTKLRCKFCNFIIKSAQDYRDLGDNAEKNFNDQANSSSIQEMNHDDDNPFATAKVQVTTSSLNSFDSKQTTNSPNPFDDENLSSSDKTNVFHAEKTISQSSPKFETNNPFASAMNNDKNDDDDDIFTGKRMSHSMNTFAASKTFTTSNSNDNLSQMKKKTEVFNADSVFGSHDNSHLVPLPKKKSNSDFFSEDSVPSTKPFTNDVFNSKQDTADDIFNSHTTHPSFPPSKLSTNKKNEPHDSLSVVDSIFGNNRPQSTSVFNSSNADTSGHNEHAPIDSLFGRQVNSSSTPVFSTNNQSIDSVFGSSNNSGGFGETVFSNRHTINADDIFGNSLSSATQSSTDIMNQFSSGGFPDNTNNNFNHKAMSNGGFEAGFGGHNSTPTSTSHFPSIPEKNTPFSFNPIQSDSIITSRTPTPPSASIAHGTGFNPFQDGNGGGGVVTTVTPNSAGMLPSGRMVRTVNGGNNFQIGNQSGQKNTSQSTDLFDLF